jgi:hypothetical protein
VWHEPGLFRHCFCLHDALYLAFVAIQPNRSRHISANSSAAEPSIRFTIPVKGTAAASVPAPLAMAGAGLMMSSGFMALNLDYMFSTRRPGQKFIHQDAGQSLLANRTRVTLFPSPPVAFSETLSETYNRHWPFRH